MDRPEPEATGNQGPVISVQLWSGCGPVVVFFGLATRLLNSNRMCMLDVPGDQMTGDTIMNKSQSIH